MKIKFIGKSDLTSKGLQFVPGFEYEVSEEVYNYLKNTFGNVEALEEEPKVLIEEEPKVLIEEESKVQVKEPKINTKVTPKGE